MKQQSLKEVQKKLQIISNALEKEKQKSKTCLKTLKDYENLAREKEDQINDIKRAIIDINEQIRIQQNQETEKTMSSKVTNLFGTFFSKNIESSQKLENLEEELNNQKEENKKLVDKFCKTILSISSDDFIFLISSSFFFLSFSYSFILFCKEFTVILMLSFCLFVELFFTINSFKFSF